MWSMAIEITMSPETPLDQRRAVLARALDGLADTASGVYGYGDIAEGTFTFALSTDDSELDSAVCEAASNVRAAIHGAGGHTPDWPHCEDLVASEASTGQITVLYAGSSQRRLVTA